MPSQLMRTSAVFAFLISLLFTGVSFASTSTGSSRMLQADTFKSTTTSLPDLKKYPSGTQRKKAFLNVIVPIIDNINNKILRDREWLTAQRKAQHWGSADLKKLREICQYYGVTCTSPKKVNWDSLLARVDIIPTHLSQRKPQQNQVGEHQNWHSKTITYSVCDVVTGLAIMSLGKPKAMQPTRILKAQ